ncbi:Synaptonemal complex protein 2 [Dendrobium catenatum]|uniref:Synaptonemal complex protein 2 n=1 Tax=Dendrobium catenatum TaxID=906689 RepID=A0A2I0VF00_9ASPA|nr:Synaptonemal complex protein 2 [Dendrobium catenatum]
MQKLGISSLKNFDQLRSLSGSVAGIAKTPQMATMRPSLDSLSHGSFTTLKLTAGTSIFLARYPHTTNLSPEDL